MCRLFAQTSPRPASAKDLLVESDFSLLRQCNADLEHPQEDGWGLAWFDAGGKPHLTKSGRPAPQERERFIRAAENAVSTVVIGHIRAASNPHRDDAHAHPFEDEGWVFAHNGTLTIHKEVANALGPRKKRLKTDSDSEVYFQQFLKHLAEVGDPSQAFEECIKENWLLWKQCRSSYPEDSTPYTSLNAVASRGEGFHALCHSAGSGLARHGVCHPDQPWQVMSLSTRGERIVLASEGLDGEDWTRLSPPETISAVPLRNAVALTRRRLILAGPLGPIPEVSRT